MDEWEIPPLKSDGNKVHKRFCRLLIIMAFVGGALIEIGDNSTPGECEEGGALASIGGFLFWTSLGISLLLSGCLFYAMICSGIYARKLIEPFYWMILRLQTKNI